MTLIDAQSAILDKTRELCAAIAENEEFLKLQESVENFLNDDEARLQYRSVHEQGEQLHQKQHAGIELGSAEIRSFEAARDAMFENPLTREFFQAREQLDAMQTEISRHVNLTIELGRVPNEDELAEASGGGC
ncbi:MAG: YlbF family regulator [Luteolibacter sp.]